MDRQLKKAHDRFDFVAHGAHSAADLRACGRILWEDGEARSISAGSRGL
jgi:hypothetical protein